MAWAFIADCDINSEVIRCIGEARFTVWGVYRLFALRDYKAKVTIKGQALKSNKDADLHSNFSQFTDHYSDDNFKHLCIFNTPWIGSSYNHAPMSKLDDGTNDIVYMTMDKSRYSLTKLLL
jgi:sphingosine kinase